MLNKISIFILSLVLFVACNQDASETLSLEKIPEDELLEEGLDTNMSSNLELLLDEEDELDFDNSISKSRQNAITNAVKKAGPSIVSITVTELQRGYTQEFDPSFFRFFTTPVEREVQSMGSGFIISADGLIVTNEHVAGQSAKKIMVVLSDGSQYEAELLGSDALADLSLLKIKSEDKTFPFVEFEENEEAIVGEWAIAMGNPFGLFEDGKPTVTVGVVSATQRDFRPDPNDPHVYVDMIQTDAAINRGNSGGPLINSEGKVIGVNTFIFTGGTSAGFVGLGFAIPSQRTQQIIKQLLESGMVSLDFDLGLEITPMTRKLVFDYNLPTMPGLFVTEVNKSGPAYEGGILPGDIIVKIGDTRVSSEMHAWALMREYKEGAKMNVQLVRNGNYYEAKLTLRKRVMGR